MAGKSRLWVLFLLLFVAAAPSLVAGLSDEENLQTLFDQKLAYIINILTGKNSGSIRKWLVTEMPNGQFTDVNYAAGCDAEIAAWPAQQHWTRLRPIAAAYSGYIPISSSYNEKPPNNFTFNATVKADLDLAMNWWFDNDFTVDSCLDNGGTTGDGSCPCGTPGMWNPNWFPNIVTIPMLSGQACLIYSASLSMDQRTRCIAIGDRSYASENRSVNGIGILTGANTLDLADVGVMTGLLKYLGGISGGADRIREAYTKAHDEIVIHTGVREDGIQADGSFSQHNGVLYDGNYGKEYTVLFLALELPAAGTDYQAEGTTKSAIETHVDGFQWMIYANSQTSVTHWDLSTVGRMISYAVSDNHETAELKVNLTLVAQLGDLWQSTIIEDAMGRILENDTFANANAGGLVGNRMFWSNDYMVHRGSNYISTLKMTSNRTSNSECLNGQNLLGFNLGSGVVFTYGSGAEYEDVAAAWDWNLLPGITTAYGATPLNCKTTGWDGTSNFVGGASTGSVGAAAMKWTNPIDKKILTYQKAWFFFKDGVHHVLVPGTTSNVTAEIYSVLDQKKHNTDSGVYVDGRLVPSGSGNFTGATSLWHDGVGYTFERSEMTGGGFDYLAVNTGTRTGDWSTIGESNAGVSTVDMFTAYIRHTTHPGGPVSYSMYPGTESQEAFAAKAEEQTIQVVQNDGAVSSVLETSTSTLMAVFWQAGNFSIPDSDSLVIGSDHPIVLVYDLSAGNGTVADPTQLLKTVRLTIGEEVVTVNLQPKNAYAGQSIGFRSSTSIVTAVGKREPTCRVVESPRSGKSKRHLRRKRSKIFG